MTSTERKIAGLAVVITVVVAAASAGYYTTGLLYDSETATLQFVINSAGNQAAGNTAATTAGNAVTATAGNTATAMTSATSAGEDWNPSGDRGVNPVGTETGAARGVSVGTSANRRTQMQGVRS